ncbi:Uncharacterised protein [Vibrio cholerae]|nr:Uncharacterised protein [Vibrio cholerae]
MFFVPITVANKAQLRSACRSPYPYSEPAQHRVS